MNDKMRVEFEAWWRREYENTLYCESAWRGWQASRATLVVELPERHGGVAMPGMSRMFTSDVVKAIEAAGVRVKL